MRKHMGVCLLGAVWACLALSACSDDDDPTCPNVSGQWEITQHCQPTAVGSFLSVQQNGCNITTDGVDTEFQGTVAASGEVSVQGSLVGIPIQCSGTGTPVRVTLNCSGACAVTLERPGS